MCESLDGQPSGQGKMVYATGSKLTSFPTGWWSGNCSSYEGSWLRGTYCQRGKMVWGDGASYEGDFKDGKMNGHGKFTWPNGHVYDGDWKDERRNGRGKMTWLGGSAYAGEWKDDELIAYL